MTRRPGDGELDRLSAPLRADVRRLSTALGEIIAESGGTALVETVEEVRRATSTLRETRGPAAVGGLERLVSLIQSLDLDRAEAVARAFTVYFQLVNLAEERHRVRILRERSRSGVAVVESLEATVRDLRTRLHPGELEALVARLEIRPVLTAHPTEARRRAVVDAVHRIAEVMDLLDDPRLLGSERLDADRRLREEIAILWRTGQLRRQRPSPIDEVRSVMSVFDKSLFTLIPVIYREFERALILGAGGVASEDAAPSRVRLRPFVRWGSWVGGDRDGNAHVTHRVTEAALTIQSTHVLLALEAAARRIGRSLTLSEESTPPSTELLAGLENAVRVLAGPAEDVRAHSAAEPHRAALLLAADRLRATRLDEPGAYLSPESFIADLRIIQDSLWDAGAGRVAAGQLHNLVWQAETFGFHLASLEVRQHSSITRQVVAELLPDCADDAAALDQVVAGESVRSAAPRTDTARELLATFRVMARLQARFGAEACRRYVVSFTQSAADVVAVRALAWLASPGRAFELDVVPLFESRADLEAATSVLDGLLSLPGWRDWLDRRGRCLEVMLGYSDATKDAGYLAANLALHRAQSELVGWAAANAVCLTIFHGRGGAVGRGGGPAGRAIRSQAPGSVAGRFKVTEQGEVIFARYGNPTIALRHLEQVTSAVLAASTARHEEELAGAHKRFQEAEVLMASVSEAAYRSLVEAPGFPDFFATVTPLDEIGRLALGSRPARRNAGPVRDLDQLRAIPWVFAWGQNRCNLPGWYGLGSGLQAVVDREGVVYLRQMVRDWPLLAAIVDNAEMSLAKADPMIAGLYLSRGKRPDLVDAIREEFRLTRRLVLEITGRDRLLATHPILRLAVDLRNPYVDALSLLQLRFLDELQEAEGARQARLSALVRLTVSGIAAGLQNTG